MARRATVITTGLVLVAAGVGGYLLWRPEAAAPIVGVGDVVAELSAEELTASVAQARAALDAASANRDHVYAGVRDEEIASLKAGIAKAKAKLDYAQAQLTRTA